ncbi:MAG: DUF4962 domain-containing protein [Acidobacteria bacterium]|nr:DUF4962 domain-containing protein [Acidobacteriota bacterium]
MRRQILRFFTFLFAIGLLLLSVLAQDARESLGPKDKTAKAKETHPLTGLMSERNSGLRTELRGKHPRVYVTGEELKQLRQRSRTTHRELWQRALQQVRALKVAPPPPPAEERRAQNEVGIGIAEAALVYKIEGDKKYLDAAKKYMEAATSYDVWGYAYNKPNVDLAAGHLLYGMGWGYDLLYNDLTETERTRYRDKLAKQARLLFDYYKPKPGRTYSYSQNHVFIPMAGLGVTAYALYDEVADAPEWAKLARAIYDRVLATYSPDGYYYEGFEYWIFSTPWLVHYLDAHAHATGEDLYDQPGFRLMHKYVAHSMMPGGKYVFDFGDVYEGSITRAGKGDEYQRANPGGQFHSNYNLLYRFAARFKNSEAQGVAEWMKGLNHYSAENYWSLLWYDDKLTATPIRQQPASHYFPDHEVVFYRTDWTPAATAFAFKCGPPEGHHAAKQLKEFADWHLSSGHAHPDAGSFIISAGGQTLTGDSGYAGVPMTAHHNTLLVDGKGQANEGKGHDAFNEFPYHQLDRVRIAKVKLAKNQVYIRGEADTTYQPKLGLTRFTRHFSFRPTTGFELKDELAANQASIFTTLLHADEKLEAVGKNRFLIRTPSASLEATIIEPTDFTAQIEPNILTAPGKPGSVDKGDRQQRGERLAVSNAKPSTFAQFLMKLKIVPASLR